MPQPWCTRCHAPSAENPCARCQEPGSVVELAPHPEAERTAPKAWEQLKAWQRRQARVQGTDGFMVVPNKALAALAAVQPETREALVAVPGIGPKKARDYGAVLLAYFRALHQGSAEEPQVARAPMPEGLTEQEEGMVLELRAAAQPLGAMAAARGLGLEAWLAQVARLVEKGAVDLPHIYCSPAEVAWVMPRLEQGPLGPERVAGEVPEASAAARWLLPALARFRRGADGGQADGAP